MAIHYWGDDSVDWEGIDDAAAFIGLWLRKIARVNVHQYKEKFGQVRVYCTLGFDCLHSIIWPGYCWIHQWWPYRFDLWLSYHTPVLNWVNRIVVPIQAKLYRWRYKKAIKKWPHLKKEILCAADHHELLKGLENE